MLSDEEPIPEKNNTLDSNNILHDLSFQFIENTYKISVIKHRQPKYCCNLSDIDIKY